MSRIGSSMNKSPDYRRHAVLQTLAIATAMAAVCVLPDTDFGRFFYSMNLQLRTLESYRQDDGSRTAAGTVWALPCGDRAMAIHQPVNEGCIFSFLSSGYEAGRRDDIAHPARKSAARLARLLYRGLRGCNSGYRRRRRAPRAARPAIDSSARLAGSGTGVMEVSLASFQFRMSWF